MGKRVPQDDRPYRPVEEALVRAVLTHQGGEGVAEANGTDGPQQINRSFVTTSVEISSEREVLEGVPRDRQEIAQVPLVEKLTREKRVLLTFSEEREIERLVARIAEELGTPVKLSHMLRAYMTLLLHAENEIVKRAHQVGPLHRPSNGDPLALIRFEQRLAQILSAAFRDAPPIR
jgi:hypothetical protein